MIVSRRITLTQGNIDNHHFYVTDCTELFPDDVFGGSDQTQAAPRSIRIHYGTDSVETDIVRNKNIFRARGWVREFFTAIRAAVGDQILIEQLDPYIYRVSKVV